MALSNVINFEFSFAFQPIVDFANRSIFSYEALVRGSQNESSDVVLKQVTTDNQFSFDKQCREKVIQLASSLKIPTNININFFPSSLINEELYQETDKTESRELFPVEQLIYEVTEAEPINNHIEFDQKIKNLKELGLRSAIDDFGSGHSSLNLLANFQPDFLKIDRGLIREIHQNSLKQSILKTVIKLSSSLNIPIIAEGVETKEEFATLQIMGINLFQGYLFAHPSFESIETADEIFAKIDF